MSPQQHRHPFRGAGAHRVIALLLALACVGGIVALLFRGSPREWVLGHYRQVSHEASTGSYVLESPRSVTQTAAEIRKAWKPAQQVVDPSGVYLRYQDLVVAVRPRSGGSTVYVDDERHGYAHWYGHVGGSWGVGSPVDGTRGGGPGSGK